MIDRRVLAAFALVALLAGGALLALAIPAPSSARAPHAVIPPVGPSTATAGRAVASAAPHAVGALSASGDAATQNCGGTPSGAYNWATQNFFTDVATTFWTPGSPALSGSNFQPVPCTNIIPTYTNGFWINISTNVPITTAEITIWGNSWPTPSNPLPLLKGFDPANPTILPMFIEPPFYRTATFYLNDYRNFWPGSTVYFNVTLTSTNATPSTIYSASPYSGHEQKYQFNGGVDNATWAFYVASPFSEQPVGQTPVNFSNIISVYTSPSVLTDPAFSPNPQQKLQVYLQSLNFTGAGAPPIPMAQGQFTLSGGQTGVYSDNFGPTNHTVMYLDQLLGPYPGTTVQFNVTVWLPWEGGAIDYVFSKVFTFNWSANGGWWNPTAGLEGNLLFSTFPSLAGLGANPTLATGTPLNVSIHEPLQNVTISSAQLLYRYSDSNGVTYGSLPLNTIDANTSYIEIPGLPPGGSVRFSVIAKDIYGNALSSGNYSYTESGAPSLALAPGYGVFYFEAIDVATGRLVPSLNFTVSNQSWSETTVGYPFGFANAVVAGGRDALAVSFGTYTVTVRAFGLSQSWTGSIASQTPIVVLFYLTSTPLSPTYGAPTGALTISGAVGLIGAAITAVPIVNWFRERRRKAEAEQRRISL